MNEVMAILFFPACGAVVALVCAAMVWWNRRPDITAPFAVVNWRSYRAAHRRFRYVAQAGEQAGMRETAQVAQRWLRAQASGGGPFARRFAAVGARRWNAAVQEFDLAQRDGADRA